MANLQWADLSGTNLQGADLRGADLRGTDLSGTNLQAQSKWLKVLEENSEGYIAYKRIGATDFMSPSYWEIKPGAFLMEVCHPDRSVDCACGVNVGTKEWCENNYKKAKLWKVLIHWKDAADIVIPYNTEGKFRAARVQLLYLV